MLNKSNISNITSPFEQQFILESVPTCRPRPDGNHTDIMTMRGSSWPKVGNFSFQLHEYIKLLVPSRLHIGMAIWILLKPTTFCWDPKNKQLALKAAWATCFYCQNHSKFTDSPGSKSRKASPMDGRTEWVQQCAASAGLWAQYLITREKSPQNSFQKDLS